MSQGEQTMQELPVLRVTKNVSEIKPGSGVGLVVGWVGRVVVLIGYWSRRWRLI